MRSAADSRPGVWGVLPLALTAAYPFAAFLGLKSGAVSTTAWLVLAVVLVQFPLLMRRGVSRVALTAAVAAALSALAAALLGRASLLLVLPALTNLALAATFFGSLRTTPLVEHLARRRERALSAEKVAHCRKATELWASFFVANAGLILALAAFAPLAWWTLYTGVITHVMAVAVGLTELAIRLRKFGLRAAGPRTRAVLVCLTKRGPTS